MLIGDIKIEHVVFVYLHLEVLNIDQLTHLIILTYLEAGILKAFEDGLDNKMDPGEPEKQNIYDAMKEGKEVDKLPLTLGEAIQRLDSDDVVKSALPEDMLRVFMHYKKDEWEKFLSAVTQWDVDTYLDVLP